MKVWLKLKILRMKILELIKTKKISFYENSYFSTKTFKELFIPVTFSCRGGGLISKSLFIFNLIYKAIRMKYIITFLFLSICNLMGNLYIFSRTTFLSYNFNVLNKFLLSLYQWPYTPTSKQKIRQIFRKTGQKQQKTGEMWLIYVLYIV